MTFPDFELELDHFDRQPTGRLIPGKMILSFCDGLKGNSPVTVMSKSNDKWQHHNSHIPRSR